MKWWFVVAFLVGSVASAAEAGQVEALLRVAPGLTRPVLEAALTAREHACELGRSKSPLLAVIDYSLPSTEKRLWVLDTAKKALLFHELVTHGRGSGDLYARTFSNRSDSHQTSIGTFVTGDVYVGKHGRSLALEGLERGFNDLARARAIVIHGAAYATDAFARKVGRLGLSWGCPAVAPEVAQHIIDTLGRGSVLFAWYPDREWLRTSAFVHG